MDLRRNIFFLVFMLLYSLTYANPINYGIALVHGTGDHREDAIGGYWKSSYINYLAKSLPDPDNVMVVSCNYSKYMWDEEAGGCTADQLLAFVKNRNINHLTVYTHSNGGNVLRWILSNPTYDPRYYELSKVIKQVIAIAPSSAGTPLADEVISGAVFEEAVGWLLGFRNDSVKQQREGDMAIFNDSILLGTAGRPSLPVPFRVIIGSNISASPLSSSSYCNGYWRNLGLKITKIYLEKCSDGFLNCSSQAAAGDVWFVDKDKTDNELALSHNQSRHSCFGLGQVIRRDLQQLISQGAAS